MEEIWLCRSRNNKTNYPDVGISLYKKSKSLTAYSIFDGKKIHKLKSYIVIAKFKCKNP